MICAEGYLFELERRGYLQAGAFVPEVVLENPGLVEQLHREFVHAGSDVVEAFTYYGHREKLRLIGREKDLEPMNRMALKIAKKVARDTGTLFAGNICNTTAYIPDDKATHKAVRKMFDEQLDWAAAAGVDFVIGETYTHGGEALMALDAIKAAKMTAVITLAIPTNGVTREGWTPEDACKRLEDRGVDVVGLNCARGPKTMLPLLRKIRKTVKVPMAALPVAYRTTAREPTFQSLTDRHCNCIPRDHPFPIALDPFTCNRFEIAEFGKAAYDLGVRISEYAAGRVRIMFAHSPRRSGASHRPAATRPICRSITFSATPRACASSICNMPGNCVIEPAPHDRRHSRGRCVWCVAGWETGTMAVRRARRSD